MSREAMKMALEALESDPISHAGIVSRKQAIAALRQALVDADGTSQERVDEIVKTEHDRAVELGQAYERGWNAALAQQEPVAWASSLDFDDDDQEIIPAKDKGKLGTSNCDIPLYTVPKQWQVLTDEQVEDEWERITGHSIFGGDRSEGRAMHISPDEVIEFSRTIEQALKEKNT